MRQAPIPFVVNGDMSADIKSTGINLAVIYAYAIQGIWSGGTAPVGTFKLQGSNFNSESGAATTGSSQPPDSAYTDITGSSQAISGTPGSILYDVTQCSYRWVRLVYTRTSGSGTINATCNLKGS